jgi:phosphoribosylamine--glycine ligase
MMKRIHRQILQPTLEGLAMARRPFRGILYAGLMITAEGPKVVEFNCRLGDPEAQVVLPLMTSDLAEAMWLVTQGNLSDYQFRTSARWALAVVMAAAGYPGEYQNGKTITGLPGAMNENVMVFHSGTVRGPRGRVLTNGGRVLAATGVGETFQQARNRAYRMVGAIKFEGAHYRMDIGAKALRHLKK